MSCLSEAIERLKAGRPVLLVDDEHRENEGDLVFPAQFVTGEQINFAAKYARGLICLALDNDIVDRLGLSLMVADNRTQRKTAFTVSIEAREGVTTGISAFDRARTIHAAASAHAKPHDIVSPGHVFPLRAVAGGVLVRAGHTEGSVDLMRIAGLRPAAVICELMADNGEMARMPELRAFSEVHDVPILSVAQVIAHRVTHERLVEEVAVARMPIKYSAEDFQIHAFRSLLDSREHLALTKGGLVDNALVRVHSECLTGDVLGSQRCDCGEQLQCALKRIGNAPSGALIYLAGHEGRGVGLANKIRAYALQDQGMDTVDANTALGFLEDERDYGTAAQILKALGAKKIHLLTNNPHKTAGLRAYGVEIGEEIPLILPPNPHNAAYLAAKRDKMGHRLSWPPSAA